MQNKYWLGLGLGVLTIAVAAGGVFYWNYSKNSQKVSFGAASEHISSAQQNPSNYASATAQGNLGVGSGGSAQNLGQISQSGGLTDSQLGGSTPTKPSSSSGSASSTPTIDPSTFSQYDKYKTATQALFGEVSPGSGAALGNGQTATVVYKGWLTNGQLFDQSKAGSDGKLIPFQFKVGSGQVIPGWDQGLVGMKTGGVRLIIVPPAVGYGANGQGPIPGNAVLVFLVQLVSVN